MANACPLQNLSDLFLVSEIFYIILYIVLRSFLFTLCSITFCSILLEMKVLWNTSLSFQRNFSSHISHCVSLKKFMLGTANNDFLKFIRCFENRRMFILFSEKWKYSFLISLCRYQQANGSKVNLLYSTPSCYTYYVNRANKTLTTKEDDFFPYAHRPHSFWTGYFTSRPTLKGYVRSTNNFYQACSDVFS